MKHRYQTLLFMALFSVCSCSLASPINAYKTTINNIMPIEWQANKNLNQNQIQQALSSSCNSEVITDASSLNCDQFNYLRKNRKLLAYFEHSQLSLITISNIRDYSAELTNVLKKTYGEPNKENSRFIHYKAQGICIDYADASIHFILPTSAEKRSFDKQPICLSQQAIQIERNLSARQWLEDLKQLDQHIRNNHVSPFWLKTEANYTNIVGSARSYFQSSDIESAKAFSYFEKMIAYLSDGHAYIDNKTFRYGAIPVSFKWLGDELIIKKIRKKTVKNTTKNQADLLGAKVTHIGDFTLNQAGELLKPFIPSVHQSMFKNKSQFAYRFAGLLYAAGITQDQNQARFTLSLRNGKIINHVFSVPSEQAVSQLATLPWASIDSLLPKDKLFSCQRLKQRQCVEYLEEFKSVYFRYRSVTEEISGDIKQATALITSLFEENNAERLVIDVRENWGGNSYLNSTLLNAIINNAAINQRGKLYLLTNHNTFSAAINFSSSLAYNSKVIVVGESYADSPIFPGESGPQAVFRLNHSNTLLSLSFSHWQSSFQYDRQSAMPIDIPVANSFDDMMKGHDNVLFTALTHQVTKSSLKAPLTESDYDKWIGRYDYSDDKALDIKLVNGKLSVLVEGEISADLYLTERNTLHVIGKQLHFTLADNNLTLFQDSQPIKTMRRLASNQYKPLELLLKGQVEAAKSAYKSAYDKNFNNLALSGNKLGILASKLRSKYNNEKLYHQLKDIAIALHGYPVKSWEEDENVH